MQYPQTRLRRNRQAKWLRDLVAENHLKTSDLIYPIFVLPEKDSEQKIKTMPDIFRLGQKQFLQELNEVNKLGINAVALFPVVPARIKDEVGKYAINKNNFLHNYIKLAKDKFPEIGIICDVALDPYTNHGHDGVLNKNGDVDNDKTIEVLTKQSVLLAKAGADFIAPSDMMDGRIGAIRAALDENNLKNTGIISYAAKYASNLYSPFRDAVGSSNAIAKKDKKTYQMDYRNIKEAFLETQLDINEGADIILVKPASFYLDVIYALNQQFSRPIFAYQVSGEYAMIKHSALAGILDFDKMIVESLVSIKRAGSSAIFTYAAKHVAKIIT